MKKEAAQHVGSGRTLRSRFYLKGFSLRELGLRIKASPIVAQALPLASLVPGLYFFCRASFLLYFDPLYLKHVRAEKITDALIKQRVKLAKKRHDLVYYHNINAANRNPRKLPDKQIEDLFPSRRKWLALGKATRNGLSPIDRNKKILSLMVGHCEKQISDKQPQWYKNLSAKVENLYRAMQKWRQGKLASPEIRPVPKPDSKDMYRPIAAFDLHSQIRIGRAASYIREKIDPAFLDCSYAFRARNSEGTCPTHHDAVSKLVSYRQVHAGKTLYVSECDIKKFFDILNHKVVISCFYNLVKLLKEKGHSPFDSRALAIFRNYLECYTYEKCAVEGAQKFFKNNKLENAKLDRPKIEDLKTLYLNPENERYGIPQGGALSPIIANIVLHWADIELLQAFEGRSREELFYARYCDDMVLIHPDKEFSAYLLDVYCGALKRLNLLVHEPKNFSLYDKGFYNTKSKKSYPWGAPVRDRSAVPWVSFVGYQVGFDGSLRVRKASIDKEIEKQKKIAINTVRSVRRNGRLTERSVAEILYRLKSKLSSMAVGKRYQNTLGPAEGMCWANGFKLLNHAPFEAPQLKQLDKARDEAIKIAEVVLKKRGVKLKVDASKDPEVRKKFNRYFGYPFSYRSAFDKRKP